MPIDFDAEITMIASRLMQVEGYLDCEKIVLQSIEKYQHKDLSNEDLAGYLQKMSAWFHNKMKTAKTHPDYSNYLFAAGCVDYLLKMN